MGTCRREELRKIEINHVEDLTTALLVHIVDPKTKTERQFAVEGNFYKTCKKYMELRPSNLPSNVTQFFLNYQLGKCTKQPIGINKFGSLAKEVAQFLKLPNPTNYTGHCLRRSSSTILVDSGTDLTVLKRPRSLRPTTVTEGAAAGNNVHVEPVPAQNPSTEWSLQCKVEIEEHSLPPSGGHHDIPLKSEPNDEPSSVQVKTERIENENIPSTSQAYPHQIQYYWKEYKGSIPGDAVVAGKDARDVNVYIGQAYVKSNGLIVVEIHPGITEVYAPCGGIHQVSKYIKILCGPSDKFYWMAANTTELESLMKGRQAVIGGHEDISGEMYIGRIFSGGVSVGKINVLWPGESYLLHYHESGYEKCVENYEVLMYDGDGPRIFTS